MKLSLEQLRAVASGVSYVSEEGGAVTFHRFTEKQEELYRRERSEIAERTLFPAGVKLCFRTDSRFLGMKASFATNGKRRFFSTEVFKNGEKCGDISNFDVHSIPSEYGYLPFELGHREGRFDLGEGEKELCIHLPWSVMTRVEEITLDDNASFLPVHRTKKRLLALGDSITQGCDALYPSGRYPARLAEILSAEEHNKAIAAETFFPALAELLSEEPAPDYISVAYGTNDWYHKSAEELVGDARAFFASLAAQFPESELLVITPIWRADWEKADRSVPFTDLAKILGEAAACHPKAHVINGLDIYPHDKAYFPDNYLHPGDEGFRRYAAGLARALMEIGLI